LKKRAIESGATFGFLVPFLIPFFIFFALGIISSSLVSPSSYSSSTYSSLSSYDDNFLEGFLVLGLLRAFFSISRVYSFSIPSTSFLTFFFFGASTSIILLSSAYSS
jgi:hypothetical protein